MKKGYCVLVLLFIEVAIAEPQWYNSSDGRQYLIESAAKVIYWDKINIKQLILIVLKFH